MATLWVICERSYFPRKLNLGPPTRRQYKLALDCFGRTLGHEPEESDLNDDALLLWTRALLDRELSPYTINERVGRIKTLWSWLAKRGLCRTFPTVPRLTCPEPTPRAWTEGELSRLFAAADLEGGLIGPVPARLWWQARLAFHWFCGERFGAVKALRQDWCDLERAVCTIPAAVRKGRRKPATYHLPAPLVESLRQIWVPARELVFPWPWTDGAYWLRWNRILRHAGLPGGRRSKTQALRISHATHRQRLGDDASRALLHSDPATTARHYIDRSFAAPPKPLPDPRQR